MLLLLPNTLTAVAIAVTATLSVSSARNMWSTFHAFRSTPGSFKTPATAAELLRQLQECSRKESLNLFLHASRVPSIQDIEGAWDGVLLENNGWIMTEVSQLLTHKLFSKGRRWNGKTFQDQNRGINRFTTKTSTTEFDHTFDYQIETSALCKDQKSLVLRYNKYQKIGSGGWTSLLWRSMVDEIRLLDCVNGECVLIGIGSMGWSGGMYNGSRK
ncbi:hypothetical protein FisN_7Lh125 [Fistulifera solaris]|uniref:Uncharacterized protein n=1 Tax=Fistulifera solaris TaxID=1519565 RepID=A0A1Z5JCM9_FISSO|nr:hypothetical protein FisN_7Lh125 [Fistulifera solaris]|eukprot:GAX11745.1 hypothetical protein FisN_7Lh125 [Fistulifera solaris]